MMYDRWKAIGFSYFYSILWILHSLFDFFYNSCCTRPFLSYYSYSVQLCMYMIKWYIRILMILPLSRESAIKVVEFVVEYYMNIDGSFIKNKTRNNCWNSSLRKTKFAKFDEYTSHSHYPAFVKCWARILDDIILSTLHLRELPCACTWHYAFSQVLTTDSDAFIVLRIRTLCHARDLWKLALFLKTVAFTTSDWLMQFTKCCLTP